MEKPLVDHEYLLEKYPGKGGWTYAVIPEVMKDKKAPFGWLRVKGMIDSYEIKNYHLMPLKEGRLFLPVKATIRKKIGKKEGDFVKVVLYADKDPTEIPTELLLCFQDDPLAYERFVSHSDGEQKAVIEWIFSARTDETKVARIATTLDKLSNLHTSYK